MGIRLPQPGCCCQPQCENTGRKILSICYPWTFFRPWVDNEIGEIGGWTDLKFRRYRNHVHVTKISAEVGTEEFDNYYTETIDQATGVHTTATSGWPDDLSVLWGALISVTGDSSHRIIRYEPPGEAGGSAFIEEWLDLPTTWSEQANLGMDYLQTFIQDLTDKHGPSSFCRPILLTDTAGKKYTFRNPGETTLLPGTTDGAINYPMLFPDPDGGFAIEFGDHVLAIGISGGGELLSIKGWGYPASYFDDAASPSGLSINDPNFIRCSISCQCYPSGFGCDHPSPASGLAFDEFFVELDIATGFVGVGDYLGRNFKDGSEVVWTPLGMGVSLMKVCP